MKMIKSPVLDLNLEDQSRKNDGKHSRSGGRSELFKRRLTKVRQVFERGKNLLDGEHGNNEICLKDAEFKFKRCEKWLNKVGSKYNFKDNEEKQLFLEFQKS